MHNIESEIKLVIFRLGIAYAVALLIFSLLGIWINSVFHKRLAMAFSESAHNSVVSGDMRQAISILNPALYSHFSSVSLLTKDGTIAFSLPFESRAHFETASIWSSVVYYDFDTALGEIPRHGKILRFTYSWINPLYYIFAIWAAMLTLAFPIFRKLRSRIEMRHNEILELKSAELMSTITSQVSHDIRSPLAALNNILNSSDHVDLPILDVANGAIKRINEIANQLLNPNSYKSHVALFAALPTSAVINEIIKEKLVELGESSKILIRYKFSNEENIFVSVPPVELSRILSNLLNNAIESIVGIGSIEINCYISGSDLRIEIIDSGKGIPEQIIPHLGKKRFTFDKGESNKGGSGLGLFHAVSTLEKYGGRLEVNSVLQKGTSISLKLPIISPNGVPDPINVTLVIDNDSNIRQLWELVAKKKKRNVVCFSDPNAFYLKAIQFNRKAPIFIDVELDNNLRGEDVAVVIAKMGFTEIYLSTGHNPESIKAPPCVKNVVGKEPIFE